MKILHIGDLHYRKGKKNQFDQNNIVDKLIENLKTRPEKIEFVFFTGDLVNSGTDMEDFSGAHELLFNRLIVELNIPKQNIFICAGNHDINRNGCSKALIEYFDKNIKTSEELENYCSTDSVDLKNSFIPLKHFYNYQEKHFISPSDHRTNFFTTHKRLSSGVSIGIVTLNSPWLSSGFREDQGQLLIPVSAIKQSLEIIKDCTVKILLIHHPLHWLKEKNYVAVEDLIHRSFNLMFSGHIHKEKIGTNYNANNGIYCNTTQATLVYDKQEEIGYSLLDFDESDECSIIINRGHFLEKENTFINLNPVNIVIPCGAQKFDQNKLRQKITGRFSEELVNANDLLLSYDDDLDQNFIKLFSTPILSKTSDAQLLTKEKENRIEFDSISKLDSNYLIYGKDKCGKSSLLRMIQLHLLKNYTRIGLAPFYIDYKQIEGKGTQYNLEKSLERYYEINNRDTNKIIDEGCLVLLIDNMNSESHVHDIIVDFLDKHRNTKFIICTEWISSKIFNEELDHLDYTKLFFQDISRTEIRNYTEKQSHLKNDDTEKILDKITALCKQLQLPLNYWTVSLILLIYKKSNDDYNKNLFGVLDLCVDEFLNKRKLSFSRGKLQFEQYKEICSKIAYDLLKNHRPNVYSCSYEELIEFISSLIKDNPRIVGEAKDIFDYLMETGILKKKENRYTFRLNGIFEYFLAAYLLDNPTFKDEILNDDSILLSFKNELEIYSGLNRNDQPFLLKLFGKLKSLFDPISASNMEYGSLDTALVAKLGKVTEFSNYIKQLQVSEPLQHHLQDSIKDEISPMNSHSDVHLKDTYDVSNINPEFLERYLSVLSRVFKNSDKIPDQKLINLIFDYLVDAYCNLGIYIIDQYEKQVIEENLRGDAIFNGEVIGEELLKMIGRFVPILSQTLLYDGLGHENLANMILAKINELKKNKHENQFKLFTLYFLLIDIDTQKYKYLIDEIFENVTLSAMKVSTLFKLNFYLAFKAYKNKDLEHFFKQKIQAAHINIDNKTAPNSIQGSLSKQSKKNLIRTQKHK